MPQIKPFHPDLERGLEELFGRMNGEMPSKEERSQLGAPFNEPSTRIQSWFTKRMKMLHHGRAHSTLFHKPDSGQVVSATSGGQLQRKLPLILIKYLERRFLSDGPRLSDKMLKRVAETYNVSPSSIEGWWHHRQSAGGKLYSPTHSKHRGGKLAELEVGRLSPLRLTLPPSNKVFKPRSLLPSTPSRHTRYSSPAMSHSPSEMRSSPDTACYQKPRSCVILDQSPVPQRSVIESSSTVTACSPAEITMSPTFHSKDICPSHYFSSSSRTPHQPHWPSFPSLSSCSLCEVISACFQAPHSASCSTTQPLCRPKGLMWDFDRQAMAIRGQEDQRDFCCLSWDASLSHLNSIYTDPWLESAAFFEPGDPCWRLVDQDLLAALEYERNSALWKSARASNKLGKLRMESESDFLSLDTRPEKRFRVLGRGAVHDEVEQLIQQYVLYDDHSQRPEDAQKQNIELSERSLSRSEANNSVSQSPASITRPSTPDFAAKLCSTPDPCLSRGLTPTDPGLCSPSSTCVSPPYPESPGTIFLSNDSRCSFSMQEGKASTRDCATKSTLDQFLKGEYEFQANC